jgi:hypothetical protein
VRFSHLLVVFVLLLSHIPSACSSSTPLRYNLWW